MLNRARLFCPARCLTVVFSGNCSQVPLNTTVRQRAGQKQKKKNKKKKKKKAAALLVSPHKENVLTGMEDTGIAVPSLDPRN